MLKAYDKALVPSYIKENTQENEKMITRFNRSFQKSIADKIEFFEVLKDKGKFYDGGEFCCIWLTSWDLELNTYIFFYSASEDNEQTWDEWSGKRGFQKINSFIAPCARDIYFRETRPMYTGKTKGEEQRFKFVVPIVSTENYICEIVPDLTK